MTRGADDVAKISVGRKYFFEMPKNLLQVYHMFPSAPKTEVVPCHGISSIIVELAEIRLAEVETLDNGSIHVY